MFFTPALAAAEWAKPGPTGPGVARPDVDDARRGVRREVSASELSSNEEGPVESYVDHGAPGVGRHVLGRHRKVRGRIVDAHLRDSEGCFGRVEHGGNRLRVTDVADDRFDRRPEFFDRGATRVEVLLFTTGDHDARPEAGEFLGDPLAQSRSQHR